VELGRFLVETHPAHRAAHRRAGRRPRGAPQLALQAPRPLPAGGRGRRRAPLPAASAQPEPHRRPLGGGDRGRAQGADRRRLRRRGGDRPLPPVPAPRRGPVGLDHLAGAASPGFVLPQPHNDPRAPMSVSPPRCPTSAGRPTSPTWRSPSETPWATPDEGPLVARRISRMRRSVSSLNQHSTRCNHLELVGMKCKVPAGAVGWTSHLHTSAPCGPRGLSNEKARPPGGTSRLWRG
jgi:hypothetical protein